MKLPDGSILMHGPTAYDPVKSHQYYLRTRQLKGRKKAAGDFTVKTRTGATRQVSQKELTEMKALAEKRVGEIKQNLAKLSAELKKAMREAEQKKSKSHREAKKPDTAAEKSKAARESKQYRKKHQQKIATKRKAGGGSKKSESKKDPVADLQKKVTEVKARLSAAVERLRSLSSAVQNG